LRSRLTEDRSDEEHKFVAFRIGEHVEPFVTTLADVGPNSTEAEKSFGFGSSVGGPKVEVAPQLADLLRRPGPQPDRRLATGRRIQQNRTVVASFPRVAEHG